jgi:cytochrome c oxidase subunit 2
VVLTPDGTVSRYFLGIEYPSKDVRFSLVQASQHKIGTLAERLLLLCFHYDPKSGRYTLLITRVMQFAGCGTVLLLGLAIVRFSRSPRPPKGNGPGAGGAIASLALFPPFLTPASNLARTVDGIFYSLTGVCGFVTLGVCGLVLYSCVRFREGARVSRTPDNSSMTLEIVWTSATLVAFVAIFIWAAMAYFRMERPPRDAIEIDVVAKQWMWKAQHADGRREINELHLLVGQPVKLVMTSQDVIHDFFVPAFRTKQDVLPGRYTEEWFIPTRPGDYRLFCAEYCGMDHSHMGGWVHVQEPTEHARWLAGQPASESIVAAGARLFVARGCSGCHSPNAAVHAPLLQGIYHKPVALSDGSIVIADEQYLHDSILLSQKQITAGYQPLMPIYQGQLSEEEVMELIAYLKSLGDASPAAP